MEDLEYITYKAMIQCDQGGAPGLFTPTYNQTIKINSCLVSTKIDKIPLTNIPDFVTCKKGGKCTPAPTEWTDTYPVKVKGQQTLIGQSCNLCSTGGKITFLTSGQIPLTPEEEAQLQEARDSVQEAYDKEQEEKNKPWWQKAGEFVVDCIPVVGPVVSLVKNISQGNWGMAALDIGFLALDVVGLAAAPFTGGASVVGTTAAKAGIRQAVKAGAKQVAKAASRQALEAGAKQMTEMLSKLSLRRLTGARLCVFACFPAGTPIATKEGLKPIESIQVGDEVWSYDEQTGEIGLKPVVTTFERKTSLLVTLEIDGEKIVTTPEHPFYTNGEWREAGLLEVGDQLMLFSGRLTTVGKVVYQGSHAPVSSAPDEFGLSIAEQDEVVVHNFEVADWHTYFVGENNALVHNAGGTCVKQATREMYEQLGKKLPCFPAGTLIDTPLGKVAIELLITGMDVFGYDLVSQQKVVRKIRAVYTNATQKLVEIHTEDEQQITATLQHRFWCIDKQAWLEAERLRVGMQVQNSEAVSLTITDVNTIDVLTTPTYNLEVDDVHNYYAGPASLLVHNGTPSVFGSTTRADASIYRIIDKSTGETVYVGKTIQNGNKRFSQHALEKGLDPRRFSMEVLEEGSWTAYETAVREQHNIKKYGTKTAKITGKYAHVFNKINAISERKFIKYFNLHNLC